MIHSSAPSQLLNPECLCGMSRPVTRSCIAFPARARSKGGRDQAHIDILFWKSVLAGKTSSHMVEASLWFQALC